MSNATQVMLVKICSSSGERENTMRNSPEIRQFIRENKHLFWWITPEERENIDLRFLVETILSYGDEKSVNNYPCIALWGTMCIHSNGDVGLCCMDTESSFILGNVYDQSIQEIWNSPTLNKIRDLHLKKMRKNISLCNGCTLWRNEKRQLIKITNTATK